MNINPIWHSFQKFRDFYVAREAVRVVVMAVPAKADRTATIRFYCQNSYYSFNHSPFYYFRITLFCRNIYFDLEIKSYIQMLYNLMVLFFFTHLSWTTHDRRRMKWHDVCDHYWNATSEHNHKHLFTVMVDIRVSYFSRSFSIFYDI